VDECVHENVTLLIVDDEESIRLLCEDFLKTCDYNVLLASDGAEAIQQLKDNPQIKVVITDIKMPGISGIEVIAEVERNHPDTGVIVLTGYASIDNTVEAMRLGALNLLKKPFNLTELLLTVEESVAKISKRTLQRFSTTSSIKEDGQNLESILSLRQKELEELHNEFLSVTSHELMTPLTPVIGFVESLIQGDLGPLADDQRQALDVIICEIGKLRTSIANLLRIKDLGEKHSTLSSALVDVTDIINGQVTAAHGEAEQKFISVSTRFSGDHMIYSDPEKITEIVRELLSNSIRFGRKDGFVMIRSACDDSELVISVEDDGIGIEESNLPYIFDKFYRVHRGTVRNYCGIGIGLTLVEGLVTSLGGTVNVSSFPEKGTIVTLVLPVGSCK
jgi:signal transduction histidine kinase